MLLHCAAGNAKLNGKQQTWVCGGAGWDWRSDVAVAFSKQRARQCDDCVVSVVAGSVAGGDGLGQTSRDSGGVAGWILFQLLFLPPFGTLTIDDFDNWVALFAFLATAVVAGQLSARAKQRAEEAEASRREIERMYQESQEVFERASEAKALRRSEQLKSALLDAVTHDLRTPLTAIEASVTTLLEEWGDSRVQLVAEDRREMLEVIDEEADRLNRFIESMVELARLEAGAFVLPRTWGDTEELVNAALARAERVTAGHQVEVALAPELPLVRADERALAEVVYVLVDNACKYSPAGTRVRIQAELLVQEEQIRVTVTDEGPGIPAELRTQVFDKFFRAAPEAKQLPRGGSGLGLA
jgi:K+-sensing histidine kinase KdpD